MMIKVFQKNKNGKIELSIEELEKVLNEAYWDGYKNNVWTYTYRTPQWPTQSPYCTTTADSQIILSGNEMNKTCDAKITIGDNRI